MPVLNSLHINLHQEEEVDFLLRNLPTLQVLNGLVVERDAIFSEGEYEENDDMTTDRQNENPLALAENRLSEGLEPTQATGVVETNLNESQKQMLSITEPTQQFQHLASPE